MGGRFHKRVMGLGGVVDFQWEHIAYGCLSSRGKQEAPRSGGSILLPSGKRDARPTFNQASGTLTLLSIRQAGRSPCVLCPVYYFTGAKTCTSAVKA
jgi:hypothetical protein